MITDLCKGVSFFDSPDVKMKMRILHAIDGSLDRITISEICQNAGISRQTFYRHFKSKYDIPSWHTIFCRQFYLNEIGRSINWETGYYHHLRLITEERVFIGNRSNTRSTSHSDRRSSPKTERASFSKRSRITSMCGSIGTCASSSKRSRSSNAKSSTTG